MFATKNNVTRLLNSLDSDTVTKKDNVTQLEVTCMADDKLTILVKVRISLDISVTTRHSGTT